tara:strand:+ start:160 stop:1296 length:1137 start_codon:yes stop_codon:yes gene_type:complete
MQRSPFADPTPGLRIQEGAPAVTRPSKEQIAAYPQDAANLLERVWDDQKPRIDSGEYDLSWIDGKHLVLIGATGRGIGGAIAIAGLNHLDRLGSLTVVGRDMKRSMEFESGVAMESAAADHADKFTWLNDGVAVEGEGFEKMLDLLKARGADQVIYVNGSAAASSGTLPDMPPVFVKDVDSDGLYQWQLSPLPERNIETTKLIMGELAVGFASALEAAGVGIECAAFCDWRGSLDRGSRNPDSSTYGRWGSYSTSLFLPKDIIQQATAEAYSQRKPWIDVFFPTMRTRALPFIPGGVMMSYLFEKVMDEGGIRRLDIPELGLAMLHQIGAKITGRDDNPFPRWDRHEEPLDLWLFEIMANLNDDESSDFFYKRWVDIS